MSLEQTRFWSAETDGVLRRAGWRPGRAVPTETWECVLRERGSFVAHTAARRFLSEFGGLVTYGWPADPVVTRSAVRFDPLLAEWEEETFARLNRQVGMPLYPVGKADGGASHLGIAEDGVLYIAGDSVEPLGGGIDQALDRLVSGQGAQVAPWTPDAPPGAHAFWQRLGTVDAVGAAGVADRRRPAETDRVLRAGGWFSGRSVPTATWENILLESDGYEIHDAARRFLAEFGCVGVPHPAPHLAPHGAMPCTEFRLDPLLAMWDAEIIDDLGEQAGVGLYPIGMVDRRNQYLAMADDGAVYVGMDSVSLLAPTPDEALVKLTRRVRPLPQCDA
ncbi:SUKH-3 domain-containing protein [Streptomyces sp. NPDC001480]|uniref:SUKH-3 domain-containing protein n=1 Tax=Streptomyces sp. NPDC001480 TaxID=3364577 RepID=UPI003677870F